MKKSKDKRQQIKRSGLSVRLFKGLMFGLIAGYLLAFLLGQSVWLEMRVNVGWAIPAMTLIGMALFSWWKNEPSYGWFLLLQVTTLAAFFWIYSFSLAALPVVPACLFREGYSLGTADIGMMNVIISSALLAGNGGWLFLSVKK